MKTLFSTFTILLALGLQNSAIAQEPLKITRDINGVGVNYGTVTNNYATQVVGKSTEYAELQKHLADLDTKITKKIATCTKLNKPDLADLFKDCQNELGALNIERDSIQKIEKQFKEDVLKLAETFSNTKINSDRLRKAKELFDAGKINEVHFVLNDKEMSAEGDAHLLKKQVADSLLQIDAKGFVIKAQAKATDYADPKRIDSTAYCYTQALKYYDDVQTLYDFADFLSDNQQYEKAKETFQKVIAHPKVEDWYKASANEALGSLWQTTGDLDSTMYYFTKYYEAYKELYNKDSSTTYKKHNLSVALERLGDTHTSLGNLEKALRFYEERNRLEKELYAAYPNNVDFKYGLAISFEKLGVTHMALGNLDKALGFYEEDLKLSKELYAAYPNNVDFKFGLGVSYSKLGMIFLIFNNFDKAIINFSLSKIKIEELAKKSPDNVDYQASVAELIAVNACLRSIITKSLGTEDLSTAKKEFETLYTQTKNVYYKQKLEIVDKMLLPNSDLKKLIIEISKF